MPAGGIMAGGNANPATMAVESAISHQRSIVVKGRRKLNLMQQRQSQKLRNVRGNRIYYGPGKDERRVWGMQLHELAFRHPTRGVGGRFTSNKLLQADSEYWTAWNLLPNRSDPEDEPILVGVVDVGDEVNDGPTNVAGNGNGLSMAAEGSRSLVNVSNVTIQPFNELIWTEPEGHPDPVTNEINLVHAAQKGVDPSKCVAFLRPVDVSVTGQDNFGANILQICSSGDVSKSAVVNPDTDRHNYVGLACHIMFRLNAVMELQIDDAPAVRNRAQDQLRAAITTVQNILYSSPLRANMLGDLPVTYKAISLITLCANRHYDFLRRRRAAYSLNYSRHGTQVDVAMKRGG